MKPRVISAEALFEEAPLRFEIHASQRLLIGGDGFSTPAQAPQQIAAHGRKHVIAVELAALAD